MTAQVSKNITEDYHLGIIGNGRTCALIDAEGSIVFCCLPDFDSGTVFASLLDSDRGGSFGVSMEGGRVVRQGYDRETNIFVSRFEGEDSAFDLIDFMPRFVGEDDVRQFEDVGPDLVRAFRVVRGEPEIRIHFDPRLEYGISETKVELQNQGLKATTNCFEHGREVYESVYMWSDLSSEAIRTGAPLTLTKDAFILLSYHDKVQRPTFRSVELLLQRTRAYWMLWSAKTARPGRYGEQVNRSALVLKLLQFAPTGAFIAAATTSLPEAIGGERNWDYRFCWIRDASMTVAVLNRIGHPEMATRFIDWMLKTVPTKDDSLQIMYGIRGEKQLTEYTLDHLRGYNDSRPVRVGNAAFEQNQHDIYGVLLDVIYQDLLHRRRTPEALDRIWTRVRAIVRIVLKTWQEPDRGIWEIRGEKRHFVFSKVLCWVALDRAIKVAQLLDRPDWAERHVPELTRIRQDILQKGWNEQEQAFTQTYEAPHLDASNLLFAEYGFIEATDPRFVSTVEQTERKLCVDGLMFRYRNQDDFGEPESAFTVCSFWLVKALHQIGRRDDARKMFDNLLAMANEHQLFGEDLDIKTRRHLGNFPQAYCHLALIDCALALAKEIREPIDPT